MKYPKRGTQPAGRATAEPSDHQEYVQRKDELLRANLSHLELPDDTTWREYMCAVTDLPLNTDPEIVLPEFAELKGLSVADMEMIYNIINKPVLGDNIRVKSITEVIRKMMGLNE